MVQLIDKSVLIEEIDKLLFKNKYHNDYDCGFRDGNNAAIRAIKGRIDALEVKELDLEEAIKEEYRKRRRYGGRDNMLVVLNEFNFNSLAKHFFELGLKAQKGE